MEMINNSENKSSRRDYHRLRTLQVLEKWGIEGEINQYNIRNAASSYARIQLKNQVMKWVAIGAVVFLAVFMGLMVGSVVLGIEATKDFKVKDQMIMSRSGNSPLKTTDKLYFSTLKLTTPLSVIQGIKSLRFDTQTKDGKKEYIEFEVVSFYYSTGRNLTLYGHTHMANVMADGSVEIIPVTTVSGTKRYDSSLKKRTTDATATTTDQTASTSTVVGISTCEQFINIGSTGSYALLGDIDCGSGTFLPIQSFGGFLNGNMHTIRINIDAQQGEGGVFSKLLSGAIITNTNFEGSVVGSHICGGVSARSDSNVILYTLNVYTSVVCNSRSSSSQVIAGGVIGGLQNYVAPRGIIFSRIAAQGKVKIVTSAPSSSYIGGIYGLANIPDYKIHLINLVSGTFIENLADNFDSTNNATNAPTVDPSTQINTSLFGFKSSSPVNFDNSKRNVIPKTVDINYCESNQEGIDWYWAWVDAYDAIYYSHTNTTADNELHANNSALCVYYYYHHSNAEAQCCRDFGITYDCFAQFCPNTLAYGYPCMICRPKGARNVRDTPVDVINGKLVSYFQSYEDAPRYFYNRPTCASS